MMETAENGVTFGVELRRRRIATGLTLTELASRVNYSKGHLSKIEAGHKAPSSALARRCDQILEANGELSRLVPDRSLDDTAPISSVAVDHDDTGEVWAMQLGSDGNGQFHVLNRRTVLTAGAATLMTWAAPTARRSAEELDLPSFEAVLAQLRQLGQTIEPALVLQMAVPPVSTLRTLGSHAPEPVRRSAFALAARFAEYAGWMAQEHGDDAGALWWTDHAVRLAESAGDQEMAPWALVRRAELAMYRHDWLETVQLAQQSQRAATSSRVRSFALQREAQGHALAGDEVACRQALDQAARYAEAAGPAPDRPALGSTTMRDPAAFATGWCLHDLGRDAAAVELLSREFAAVPAHARRVRARYGARLALALASRREIEQACAVLDQVLDAAMLVNSATVRTDLRQAARVLNRWRSEPEVSRVVPRLAQALRGGSPGRV